MAKLTQRLRRLARVRWLNLATVPGLGRLSPLLRWALVGSSVATLAVLLLPEPPAEGVTATALDQADASGRLLPSTAASAPPGTYWHAYAARQPPEFAEAERDPFAPEAPAVMPAPPPAVTVPPPAPTPPPPPPAPQFRVVGWFGVEGQAQQVLLTDGQIEIVAQPGLALPDGFVVQSIDAQRLVLRYPPTQTDYALSLPASLAESR
ncbi:MULTISPECIES: hypothetical protein [unclassified Roseateles]|uniref:hypothetical protein n=1 Tax=unclassified Roseateles TaxID=2626991 RepID=UPI000B27F623|nr:MULTISPECIES: hypothetical protein [unclassified Roseateles]